MEKVITTTLNGEELEALIIKAINKATKNIDPIIDAKDDLEEFLDQRAAAKYLHISLPTIIRWKKEKKLPYYQEGRTVLFKKSELLKVLRKNENLLK